MRRALAIVLLVVAVCLVEPLRAQYYSWGADPPGLKWSKARSGDVQILYPDTATSYAARTLWTIEQAKRDIGTGFRHGPMPIPFVLHAENFQSNGLVMWLPKRVEFLTSPDVESYAMPWYKQLVAHEYRHVVQYNNLNRGVIRVLSYILGQQGSTVGLLFLPLWLLEGDAVMMETAMSSYGRGLQPSFTMHYRALGRDILTRRNSDKWFSGSYREFVPDHYRVGYQLASYSYDRYNENIWDRVAYYSVRNPYVVATTTVALHKYYDTRVGKLFRATFEDLNRFWEQLPEPTPSTQPLWSLPTSDYTTYRWPMATSDTTFWAVKSSLSRPARLVGVGLSPLEEQPLPHVGHLSTRPAYDGERVWWTEYRRSRLFEQRVNSMICYWEPGMHRPHTLREVKSALYVTPYDGGLAWIEYAPDGQYTLVQRPDCGEELRTPAPHFYELHGLAWDNLTRKFYTLVTENRGMYIASLGPEGLHPVTTPGYTTLSDLRAQDGWLYFGSIRSGVDEAHGVELSTGQEYRLSTSRYGGFDPAPLNDSLVVMTDYSRYGYAPALQRRHTEHSVEQHLLPENRVNPRRKGYEVVNLDTLHFGPQDSLAVAQKSPSKRYRKGTHLFNLHSWMPISLNPFRLADEQSLSLNWGVTALSQNLLSNTEAFASWGWNRGEGSLFEVGFRYNGLGPMLDISASYGGNQLIYSLAQRNPLTQEVEYQKSPHPDKYYAVSATLSLPLYFDCGYHLRQLNLAAGWGYSNGLVANLGQIRYDQLTGTISNIEHVGFTEGLHKLAFSLAFSDQVRTAHREFAPRWGYLLALDYALNPANGSFSDLISLYGKAYLPGFVRPHSFTLALNYQNSFGGFKNPSGQQMLTYKSSRLIPKGYSSEQIVSDHYTALSAAYQLPIWYPEGGIGTILYFKRIRLNVGFDYAQYRYGEAWQHLYAYGGDLILDVNLFRQPASATSTLTLSFYQPRHGKFWFGFGLGLPI